VKRIYSLKGKRLFSAVIKKGKRYNDIGLNIIVLLYCENDDMRTDINRIQDNNDLCVRIGITVNRTFGKAIVRNKIKRKIREVCRSLLPDMKKGFMMIIRPSDEIRSLSSEQIKTILSGLLIKAGVLNDYSQ
jgi:ribonuclease P protein component